MCLLTRVYGIYFVIAVLWQGHGKAYIHYHAIMYIVRVNMYVGLFLLFTLQETKSMGARRGNNITYHRVLLGVEQGHSFYWVLFH